MKKVLIVSAHFPPLNSMAAKRYGYMCKYMEENGYEPWVLTTKARNGSFLNAKLDLECPLPEEKVFRIGNLGTTYPIDDMIMNELLYIYKKNKVSSRIIEENSFGWFYKVRREFDLNKVKDVDLVVGTFPSVCNLLVASHVAFLLKKPFVAEIRDLISDYEEGNRRDEVWQERERQLEQVLLESAAGIITVTNGFKRILQKRYPQKRISTVFNGWDCVLEDENTYSEEKDKQKYIYYAGSMYEHRVKSLKLLIDVIREYKLGIEILIRSVGPEIYDEDLKSYVAKYNLQKQVKILEAATENIVHEEQRKAKINLLVSSLDASDDALMTTIPGKLFELIRLDSPVLAIADPHVEVNHILGETGKGIVTSKKDEIASFLEHDYIKYEGYRKEVEKFSRRNQTMVLCKFFDEILNGGNETMKKSVISGISMVGGSILGSIYERNRMSKIICEKQTEKEKFKIMYQLMEKWMRIKQSGKKLEMYFESYGYKKIAIYGMGDIGKLLSDELKDSSVSVIYGIDKNKNIKTSMKIVGPDDELQEVDAVVVTAVAYFDEIDEMLSARVKCPVISLEDIVYEVV